VSLIIPESALRLVASYFDPATVERARVYTEDDRVHVVKPPPWPVVARVRGDQGYVVTVDYTASGNHMRGECSCSAAVDCEHAAATALVVLAAEREHIVDRTLVLRQGVVGDWLTGIGKIVRPPDSSATTDERLVAYVLDQREGEIGLAIHQATRKRSGGLALGAAILGPADGARGAPRWVGLDDLRRIALVRAVTRVHPDIARVPVDRLHGDLLRDLAGSGALFWDSAKSAPLGYGDPIRDALRWRAIDGDPTCERLGLDGGLVVVPARECHYVDVARARIGPLDLGVPAELVQRLLAGPPVPRSMRATVERSLGPLLGTGAALVAPAASTTREDAAAMAPRMVASLDTRPGQRNLMHVTGEVAYGDQIFALAAWDPLRPLPRDLVAEGRLEERLRALVAGLPYPLAAASSLELLANARHVAHTMVPLLRSEGWTCELSDDFPHQAPVADVDFVETLRPVGDGKAWFEVALDVVIAGRTGPLLPLLLDAIQSGQVVLEVDGTAADLDTGINLRLPDGELVHVPAERLRRWLRPLFELGLFGLDDGALRVPTPVAAELLRELASGDPRRRIDLATAEHQVAALLTLAPRAEPPSFAGALRDYQRVGLAWLHALHDAGHGGLLADEMGLGKTVQVLAFLDGLRAAGTLHAGAPALVVAPRSVVGNWAREAARFAPALATVVHLGAERSTADLAPLVITSYQTLARDIDALRAVPWTTVLLDEAQAVKNPLTQLRAAVATLGARSRFCITGTPIENHLGELWSELDLAMPGMLGRRASFDAVFRRPIEKFASTASLERLRRRIRPFLLRRTKESVALELPPKTEVVERIELDTPQRDLYETLRLVLDEKVRAALAARGVQATSMMILDALLKLRQCCCDPRLVKLPEARRVTSSAKLERLLAMLEELADSGRSTLVFSQFTSMLTLIEAACAKAGIPVLKLTGGTRNRDDVIARFQAGEVKVFLVSLKTGGVGLNLTRADTVIHYDPWWNPAAEAQATDRAHRIGQDRHVMVYKLVARGTLEETICDLQEDKRQLTAAALRDGGVTHLAPDDLAALYDRLV
jgi:superfamily II DNA or RNA helicase